ncbi:CHRD domain-containing protein [Dyadobacter sp. NIV53]|uniref:CHRD domain-containing protein n=1 Tax=Dyadobacter sp. NIV53 TaxID=2861765 RepID=UPI001C868622|nr:CHRD domain-containing protein [Dyadobacter sp. NIV53]
MKKPMKRFLLFMTGIAMFGMMSSCKEEGPHEDNIVKFSATINSAPTVPKSVSAAQGSGAFEYNKTTKELSYNISYKDITPATVTINFANPGYERGAILFTLAGPTATQVVGKANQPLTAEQQAWLIQGLFYVNITTAQNIYGEIRGQILPDKISY